MEDSRAFHYVLGAALVMMAVFTVGSLVLLNSQADTSTSVSIGNTPPSFSATYPSVYADTSASQTESPSDNSDFVSNASDKGINVASANTPGYVYFHGIAHDDNGSADISNVSLKFYASNTTSSCSTDAADCYNVASCTLQNATSPLEKRFVCAVALSPFAFSTVGGGGSLTGTFKAIATVTDGSSASASTTAKDFEVAQLLALNVPTSIAYGNGSVMALGSPTTTTTDVDQLITQYGNVAATLIASDSNTTDYDSVTPGIQTGMGCTIGYIPTANQKWSNTDSGEGDGYTGYTAFSTTPTNVHLHALVRLHGDSATSPSQNLYWGIQIPSSGVSGSCSGTTLLTTQWGN